MPHNTDSEPKITLYVTKYASADGRVLVIPGATRRTAFSGPSEYVDDPRPYHYGSYRLGHDAFLTEDEARADARKRVDKRIASLTKQLAKLKKVTVNVEHLPVVPPPPTLMVSK